MWTPQSEEQIQIAIREGNLSESSAIDVKAEIGDSPSARRETAKDLASFSIDGGALLIGVGEDKEARRFFLAPIALAESVERVEQLAALRVDPPLFIRVREIPSTGEPGKGYLWVDIPPSPQVPHMVDGRYYARGERTTRRLTDAEVDALHRLRTNRESLADGELEDEIARDPVPPQSRMNGHLYLVAEPLTAPLELARGIVRAGNNTPLYTLLNGAEGRIPQAIRNYEPGPSYASHFSNRSRGAAMTSLTAVRTLEGKPGESGAIDIELRENGGFRIFCGRLTDSWTARDVPFPVIFEGLAVAYTLRLAHWVRQVAEDTGYRGGWAFGVAGNGLREVQSSRNINDFGARYNPYDTDTYRQTTTAPLAELTEAPQNVVERLVGPLLRGLGVDRFYEELFRPPSEESANL